MPLRAAVFASLLVLAACAPDVQRTAASALPRCDDLEFTGDLTAQECQLQTAGQTLRVSYAPLAAGAAAGAVSIEVIGDRDQVRQVLLEPDVPQYLPVTSEDIDGDGRADIRIERERGAVNTASALWIYSGAGARYERAGQISGVTIERTADGFIAAPSRSNAATWSVPFYRLSDIGLVPLATVEVSGEDLAGGGVRSTCRLVEGSGLAAIGLSEREAEEKFCAEPAAQVFGP